LKVDLDVIENKLLPIMENQDVRWS
jgi:hypothetical protein